MKQIFSPIIVVTVLFVTSSLVFTGVHPHPAAVTPVDEAAQSNRQLAQDTHALKQSDWYAAAMRHIEESEYEIRYQEALQSYAAPNRQHHLRGLFAADRFTMQPRTDSMGNWQLQLTTKGVFAGKNQLYAPDKNADPVVKGNTISFRHQDAFSIDYINDKNGIRQNFIIHQAPANNPGSISVKLATNKGWVINQVHPQELHFAKMEGATANKKITYNSLHVWDANQRTLDASFSTDGNELSIHVTTTDAVYPITIDPLSTTANWTAESNQANATFGQSVASAGDVNGDGYSDVIVGANFFDNGQTDEGRAFVYHGSATGLSATPNWTAESNQVGAQFGRSVASAGDVNGDGFSDVIVGAFLFDNSLANEGGAFVYHGSATGLTGTPNWTAVSNQAAARFGVAVACAGDVNGDGYSDVIVGANRFSNVQTSEGSAFVYHGSAAGLSITANWTAESNQNFAEFGIAVGSAGDVNGDGFSDVIVGASTFDNVESDEGRAFVYHGSAAGLSFSANWTAESNQSSANFGITLASAGDVNGDGYSDVIVSAPFFDFGEPNEGRAFVYHGSSTGLSITANWTVESNLDNATFGNIVSSAGDVNGDGYSDVIVGADVFDNVEMNEGAAFVYHGSASGLSTIANWTAESNQANASFGRCVASAGDVNGDGYSDVIVGAHQFDNVETNEGAAFVYHGAPAGLSATSNWTAESNQADAWFGFSVAAAGDVNGDGYSDVIVGAHFFDNGQTNEGRAYVYHGSATGLSTSPNWTVESNQTGATFGRSVASAGDVNGDGFSDLIIGARLFDNGQTDEGRAFVYHGSATGLSTTANWTAESNQLNAQFGVAVASAGDVNGDGFSDVIVGANLFDNGQTDEGRAYVYFGSATGLSTTTNWTAESNQGGAQFGAAVASAGDVNGDGFSDVIVGANWFDNVEVNEGAAFVYLGSATGLSATANWTAESNQASANFGTAVASAGDVNGDGFSDVIVGANQFSISGVTQGQAFVYHGSATGIAATPNWSAESNQAFANFGTAVASAGDVNGDGYSDVIVGASGFDNVESNEGRAFVYHGSAAGVSTNANWTAESNQADAQFGIAVASAGDVNGDGYSDVIIGAHQFDNVETNEGAAFVFYGNNGGNLRNNLRLYNADQVTPIQQSNLIEPNLFGAGLFAKSFLGRQRGRMAWETVRNGIAFSGNPITNSTFVTAQQTALTNLGLTGVELRSQVAKVILAKFTYIRARVRYDLTTAITGQVFGPWRYPEGWLRGRRDIGSAVLPVDFLQFTANKQNNAVVLQWLTANETPGVQYEVLHSTDGRSFATLATVPGTGNEGNSYQWTHAQPATGNNYYRIRAVAGNRKTFSDVRVVVFASQQQVTAFPNPVVNGTALNMRFGSALPAGAQLTWVNAAGTVVQRELLTGSGTSVNVPVKVFTPGSYTVLIQSRDGAVMHRLPVLVL